ncbi:MAG: sensor domain-containing protein [Mycobacterium sp.]
MTRAQKTMAKKVMAQVAALLAVTVAPGVAGCIDTSGSRDLTPSASTSPTAAAPTRSYPGLFPEYRGKFHPNHTDLGGRKNADLASLLPVEADFPPQGATRPPDIAADDGSGLGVHGQTDGETRPPECLYTPFGKSFSRTPDGSDWNLYYAASTFHEADPDGNHIIVTVNRERENADVFALTSTWIKKCGQYDKAFPTFAKPEVRDRHVTDTFAPGPNVDGVQTYVYTSASTDLDDASASKQPSGVRGLRILLARVRSVVFEVEGTDQVDAGLLDQLMAITIANAKHAPPPPDQNAGRLAALPPCDTAPTQPGNPQADPALDCTIRTSDGSGVIFEVLGTPAGTIRVFNGSGAQLQSIRVPNSIFQQRVPFLQDLDQDKREELLVVRATGDPAGDLMDVWRSRPNSDQFDMTGTIFGVPRFWLTSDRFIGIFSRNGADAGVAALFRFVDNKLAVLALLDTERRVDNKPLDDPKWRLNANVKCAMNTSDDPPGALGSRMDALRAAGVDPATAAEHFCLQPWVPTLYRQGAR